MFTIAYGIRPEKREEYLNHVARLRQHFQAVEKKDYTVYEVKGKKDQFIEVFTTKNMDEFDALEDYQDPQTEALVARLQDYVDEQGMKYTSMVELA
jgi:hypothetical protein